MSAEFWFNIKEQKPFEKRSRGTQSTVGDSDKDGNVFLWNMSPRNRATIQAEWIQSLVSHSLVKPITPGMIVDWASRVKSTAERLLPNDDFEIDRSHFNPLPIYILQNRYGDLRAVTDIVPGNVYNQYLSESNVIKTVRMCPLPSQNDSPDKLWINLYHNGYGAFHSEPLSDFIENFSPTNIKPGRNWRNWIILGYTNALFDLPIGFMLESIATSSTGRHPHPLTVYEWFKALRDLICA